MHDVVQTIEVGSDTVHRVPIFNPGSNGNEVSWLRLVNLTDASVDVTIRGRDDAGSAPPGGEVRLTLPAGGARHISAQQLESGDDELTGQFGDGTGKWQLFVTASGDHRGGEPARDGRRTTNQSCPPRVSHSPQRPDGIPCRCSLPRGSRSRGLPGSPITPTTRGRSASSAPTTPGRGDGPVTLSLSARQTRHFDSRRSGDRQRLEGSEREACGDGNWRAGAWS